MLGKEQHTRVETRLHINGCVGGWRLRDNGTSVLGPVRENDGRSDQLDQHPVRMCRQGFDVGSISCEDGAARFGDCNDVSVDSRARSCASAQLRCSTCGGLADRGVDDAHLQEAVGVGVTPGIAVK